MYEYKSEQTQAPGSLIMANLAKRMRSILDGCRNNGAEYLFYFLASRCPKKVFRYSHSILVKLHSPRFVCRPLKTYQIRLATEKDAAGIGATGMYSSIGISRRLALGDMLVLVEHEDRYVAICWFSTGTIPMSAGGSIIDTGCDSIYVDGMYISDEHRLKGLFPAIYQFGYELFAQAGRNVLYGAIDVTNQASWNANRRLGFVPAGETQYIAIGGIGLCHTKYWPHPTPKIRVFRRSRLRRI